MPSNGRRSSRFSALVYLVRGVAADADEDRHAACRDRERALDQRLDLRLVERRRFAGRAERKEPVDAGGDVMRHQPFVARVVDRAVLERRDQGEPEARDRVLMVEGWRKLSYKNIE